MQPTFLLNIIPVICISLTHTQLLHAVVTQNDSTVGQNANKWRRKRLAKSSIKCNADHGKVYERVLLLLLTHTTKLNVNFPLHKNQQQNMRDASEPCLC